MPPDHASPEGPERLFEARESRDPRVVFFYFPIALLLLLLAAGLAYQQLFKSGFHDESERHQDQRRVITPGPRGLIFDRRGRPLVANQPVFSLVLYLDELPEEFRREFIRIRKNYRDAGDKDLPTSEQMEQIARITVVQRYLDQADAILGRSARVDGDALERHFRGQLLLPYTLIDDLTPADFARLIERLPVRSPLQIYTSDARYYPYGSAAAQTLGFVSADENVSASDLPGDDLTTFRLKGSTGRDGLEKEFDSRLQGEAGSTIFRVDPAGYIVHPPLDQRLPVPGHDLTTSLDIDLQLAAEQAIGDFTGAAVAIDVRTGEVLVLASKPDYDLNDFSPRPSPAAIADIEKRGAWLNRAVNGLYPPGSTFKIVTSVAGMLAGSILPDSSTADCTGRMLIGGRWFLCDNGDGDHGVIGLRDAIAESCDVFFWTYGLRTGPEAIAAEARRFGLDRPTGIDLPGETRHMVVPDPDWKRRHESEAWFPGDTANFAIGQGFLHLTPLQMACLVASVARGETRTVPTLLHDPDRPPQHSEPIGLDPAQRAALIEGMEGCVGPNGTAKILSLPALSVPGVAIAGKTGTAQVAVGGGQGNINIAWFVCFAPVEDPRIALAVAVQGDMPGENFAGGLYAAPVASAVLRKYFGVPASK